MAMVTQRLGTVLLYTQTASESWLVPLTQQNLDPADFTP